MRIHVLPALTGMTSRREEYIMDKLLSMFSYSYMTRAFIAGVIIAVVVSCLGNVMVHKRLSLIGDALAHTSLAGVALGLVAGIDPIVGAVCACLVGALFIEGVRKKLGEHSEMAVAVILSAGVGIAGISSGFIKNGSDFSSFLFGSIIATSGEELILIAIVALVVLVTYFALYRKIFLIAFDEDQARLMGIRTDVINIVITILTALTVSVSARIVGTLIISSLMVVPVAAASMVSKSYKMQLILSMIISVFATVTGLVSSFLFGLKPGGTICLVTVLIFIISLIVSSFSKKTR